MTWAFFAGVIAAVVVALVVLIVRESADARRDEELIRNYWKKREADARSSEEGQK